MVPRTEPARPEPSLAHAVGQPHPFAPPSPAPHPSQSRDSFPSQLSRKGGQVVAGRYFSIKVAASGDMLEAGIGVKLHSVQRWKKLRIAR